jgi:glycerate dehydrogenase
MTHRIVCIERDTIAPWVTVRRPAFAHDWVDHGKTRPDEVAERLKGADIAVVNKAPLPKAVLEALPDLKLIAVAATGTDNIDKAAAQAQGIVVSNIRNYAIATVPEHAFALILALRRQLPSYRDVVRAGGWQAAGQFTVFTDPIHDLAGSTLGIIGEGAIGQSVAAIGQAFGMRPLFAMHKHRDDMGPLYTPFSDVLAQSDVITLHAPLLPETKGMIGLAEFRQMTRKPILINTARGGLVDELDLVTALDQGLIAGAGFDVTVGEPPAEDHPFMALLDRPNFILTPHTAWASTEAMQTLADQLIDNIENFVAGRPTNVVQGAF